MHRIPKVSTVGDFQETPREYIAREAQSVLLILSMASLLSV